MFAFSSLLPHMMNFDYGVLETLRERLKCILCFAFRDFDVFSEEFWLLFFQFGLILAVP